MRILLTVFCLSIMLILVSCGKEKFSASGIEVSEERQISGVSEIQNNGIIDLEIFESMTFSLEVTADENLIENVITNTSGSRLNISLLDGDYEVDNFKVKVGLPDISFIGNTGTGDVTLTGFVGLEDLEVISSGTGDLLFEGSSRSLDLQSEGIGNFQGFNFSCQTINIDQSGIGNSDVSVSERLSGQLNGIGDIRFKGMPVIDVQVNGIGEVMDAN